MFVTSLAVTVASPHFGPEGWPFASEDDPFPKVEKDPLFNAKTVKELYLRASPEYNARWVVMYIFYKIDPHVVLSIDIRSPSYGMKRKAQS